MPEAVVEPEEHECPRCAEFIKARAKACRFCGWMRPGTKDEKRVPSLVAQAIDARLERERGVGPREPAVFFTASIACGVGALLVAALSLTPWRVPLWSGVFLALGIAATSLGLLSLLAEGRRAVGALALGGIEIAAWLALAVDWSAVGDILR